MATLTGSRITDLLHAWIASRVEPSAMTWLNERAEAIATGDKKHLFFGFGMVPRRVGKSETLLTDLEAAEAAAVRPGWNPRTWSLDQLARAFLVLYQTLPLLPHPRSHVLRTAEGIRSNIKSVFCAIAHQNPFPAEQLNDEQWNQLVLKCLFIDVSLDPVVGIDRRANAALMTMLVDFAHERRAAHRSVPPELWRCVGPYADERGVNDLRQMLTTGAPAEQQAAALALHQCRSPLASTILGQRPDLARSVTSGELTWKNLIPPS